MPEWARRYPIAFHRYGSPMAAPTANVADIVGGTPMVALTRVAPDCGAELVAKLEVYNPAGSVKDRIGVAMIDAAEAEGRIEPGRTTIVEATWGNTGIALAFVCAARGYDLVLTMPQGMSREREGLLRLYGAEVHITESMGGMDEAVDAAKGIAAERGDAFICDQFSNPANPEIHRRTTAEEIWRDMDGKIDVLVGGVGTGGTVTGAGERLKELNRDLPVVAVEPAASPVISGGQARPAPHPGHRRRLRAPGAQPRPARRDRRACPTRTPSATAQRCARTEGVLAGISGGAALAGAIQVGSRAEMAGKRDGGGTARLRRAVREHALLQPGVTLSPRELERYSRQLLMDDWGGQTQERLQGRPRHRGRHRRAGQPRGDVPGGGGGGHDRPGGRRQGRAVEPASPAPVLHARRGRPQGRSGRGQARAAEPRGGGGALPG